MLQQMLGNLTGMHWYTAVIVVVLLVNLTVNKLTGASIDKGVGG